MVHSCSIDFSVTSKYSNSFEKIISHSAVIVMMDWILNFCNSFLSRALYVDLNIDNLISWKLYSLHPYWLIVNDCRVFEKHLQSSHDWRILVVVFWLWMLLFCCDYWKSSNMYETSKRAGANQQEKRRWNDLFSERRCRLPCLRFKLWKICTNLLQSTLLYWLYIFKTKSTMIKWKYLFNFYLFQKESPIQLFSSLAMYHDLSIREFGVPHLFPNFIQW